MVETNESTRVKFYEYSFGCVGQIFKIGVFVDEISFEIFKEFHELTSSTEAESESACGELLKKYRNKVIDLGCDLKVFANRKLYSTVAKKVCELLGRNLQAQKVNLRGLARPKFGSSTSLNTVGESEAYTIGEELVRMSEPTLVECLKHLPKYSESLKFRAFRRLLDAYFKMVNLNTDSKKLELVEFSVAAFDREATMFAEVSAGNSSYTAVMDTLVYCLDGEVPMTEAEATRKAFQIKLSNFADAATYHNEFIILKSKVPTIKEDILVEGFIDGIDIYTIQNTVVAKCHKKLYDNFTLLKKLYTKKTRI